MNRCPASQRRSFDAAQLSRDNRDMPSRSLANVGWIALSRWLLPHFLVESVVERWQRRPKRSGQTSAESEPAMRGSTGEL